MIFGQFIRIASSVLFLIMPPFYAYLIVFILDTFDCNTSIAAWEKKLVCLKKNFPNVLSENCQFNCGDINPNYQIEDKLIDLYLNAVALFFVSRSKYFYILALLLVIRIVGVIMFCKTKNRVFLVCFPDLYSWYYLYLIGSETFHYGVKKYILILLLIGKYCQEFYLHGQ